MNGLTEIEQVPSMVDLLLSQYELKLVHVSGSQMVQSDVLSQRPDWVSKEDTDNEDQILLLSEQ